MPTLFAKLRLYVANDANSKLPRIIVYIFGSRSCKFWKADFIIN